MKDKPTEATEQACEECNQLPINCECESVIGTRWHDTKAESQGVIRLEDYNALKVSYTKAVEDGRLIFEFRGMEFLTIYAKFLLQHMENERRAKK